MTTYIITFFSHFGAMRYKKEADNAGLDAVLMPVPRYLSSSCGTCVRLRYADNGTDPDISNKHDGSGSSDNSGDSVGSNCSGSSGGSVSSNCSGGSVSSDDSKDSYRSLPVPSHPDEIEMIVKMTGEETYIVVSDN